MKRRIRVIALIVTLGDGGCGSDPAAPVVGATVQLSAQQAATVTSRIAQLALVHPELAWLADSISLVIKAGARVDSVGLVTDLGPGPFYAIGLQRAITTSTNASATFDAILFNDPSNPTDFIIVDGWSRSSTTVLPQSVIGSFGAPGTTSTVTAHLFQVAGGTVTAWRATAGTASFLSGPIGAPCPSFSAPTGITCATTGLTVLFTISAATRDNGGSGDTRSASLPAVEVPGIQLKIQVP